VASAPSTGGVTPDDHAPARAERGRWPFRSLHGSNKRLLDAVPGRGVRAQLADRACRRHATHPWWSSIRYTAQRGHAQTVIL